MKKTIQQLSTYFIVFLFCIIGFSQHVEAAKVDTWLFARVTYFGDSNSERENYDGLALQKVTPHDIQGTTIDVVLSKIVNLVRENGSIVGSEINLNKDKTLKLVAEDVKGYWNWKGITKSFGNQIIVNDREELFHGYNNYTHSSEVGNPTDQSSEILLTSNKPEILECKNTICIGKSRGTAKITISFPSTVKEPYLTSNYNAPGSTYPDGNKHAITVSSFGDPFIQGISKGYGKIKLISYADSDRSSHNTHSLKTATYTFPSVTYTVVVSEEPNDAPVITWATPNSITDSGANIKWTYSDKENDPQTGYWIQISTDAAFTTSKIVKSVSGTSAVTSRAISGLSANTKYYGRIKAKNDVNDGWTDWVSGNFTTQITDTNLSVNGACSATACSVGTKETVSATEWKCIGTNGGTTAMCPNDTTTGGGGTFSCTVSPNPSTRNQTITYRASDTTGDRYNWFLDSSKTTPVNETNSHTYQYVTSYPTIDSYYRTVEMIKNGTTKTAMCPTVTIGCGTKPADEVCQPGDLTHKVYGTCTSNGTYTVSYPSCTTFQAAEATLSFNPSIVSADSMCRIYIEAQNVQACSLVSRTGSIIAIPAVGGVISETGQKGVLTGTYTLMCTDYDGVEKQFETKSCISKPIIKEQ